MISVSCWMEQEGSSATQRASKESVATTFIANIATEKPPLSEPYPPCSCLAAEAQNSFQTREIKGDCYSFQSGCRWSWSITTRKTNLWPLWPSVVFRTMPASLLASFLLSLLYLMPLERNTGTFTSCSSLIALPCASYQLTELFSPDGALACRCWQVPGLSTADLWLSVTRTGIANTLNIYAEEFELDEITLIRSNYPKRDLSRDSTLFLQLLVREPSIHPHILMHYEAVPHRGMFVCSKTYRQSGFALTLREALDFA